MYLITHELLILESLCPVWQCIFPFYWNCDEDGLVQACGNSSANALELPQSCTKPSLLDVVHNISVDLFYTSHDSMLRTSSRTGTKVPRTGTKVPRTGTKVPGINTCKMPSGTCWALLKGRWIYGVLVWCLMIICLAESVHGQDNGEPFQGNCMDYCVKLFGDSLLFVSFFAFYHSIVDLNCHYFMNQSVIMSWMTQPFLSVQGFHSCVSLKFSEMVHGLPLAMY